MRLSTRLKTTTTMVFLRPGVSSFSSFFSDSHFPTSDSTFLSSPPSFLLFAFPSTNPFLPLIWIFCATHMFGNKRERAKWTFSVCESLFFLQSFSLCPFSGVTLCPVITCTAQVFPQGVFFPFFCMNLWLAGKGTKTQTNCFLAPLVLPRPPWMSRLADEKFAKLRLS